MTESKLVKAASTLASAEEVVAIHERILAKSTAKGRYIRVGSGRQVHVIEKGEGPPVVILHGSSTSALLAQPLLERFEDVWGIAVDRPGFGLSEPRDVPRQRFREGAVEFIDEVLDALGLDAAALGGNSMGGLWALWYALARPERVRQLILFGAPPLLPGTRVPPPLKLMATPKVGEFLGRLMKPSPKLIVKMMDSMGEKETIANYPDQINALVAAGKNRVTAEVNLAELRAAISPFGFRRELLVPEDMLRNLSVPTLLVWGDHDPVGGAEVGEQIANLIPNSQLEVLSAGHNPWLGHPDHTAELVSKFVQ